MPVAGSRAVPGGAPVVGEEHGQRRVPALHHAQHGRFALDHRGVAGVRGNASCCSRSVTPCTNSHIPQTRSTCCRIHRRVRRWRRGGDDDPVGPVTMLDAEVGGCSMRKSGLVAIPPAARRQASSRSWPRFATTLAGSVSRARSSQACSRCCSQVSGERSSARGSPHRMLPGAYTSRRRRPTRSRSSTQQA